jgi:hypothetical protein
VIEINECIRRPKPLLQLFACNELTWTLQQDSKDLEGLPLQDEPVAVATQFARL